MPVRRSFFAAHVAKFGSTDTVEGRRATAVGDLARHQLPIGFDEDEDSSGVEVRGRRASSPAAPVTQIVIWAHLSADAITLLDNPQAGVVSPGRAGRPALSVEQVRRWCGRPDVAVTVKPVIDLRERLECRG